MGRTRDKRALTFMEPPPRVWNHARQAHISHTESSRHPCEVGIMSPNEQMRKRRLREVKQVAQGYSVTVAVPGFEPDVSKPKALAPSMLTYCLPQGGLSRENSQDMGEGRLEGDRVRNRQQQRRKLCTEGGTESVGSKEMGWRYLQEGKGDRGIRVRKGEVKKRGEEPRRVPRAAVFTQGPLSNDFS